METELKDLVTSKNVILALYLLVQPLQEFGDLVLPRLEVKASNFALFQAPVGFAERNKRGEREPIACEWRKVRGALLRSAIGPSRRHLDSIKLG